MFHIEPPLTNGVQRWAEWVKDQDGSSLDKGQSGIGSVLEHSGTRLAVGHSGAGLVGGNGVAGLAVTAFTELTASL